LTWLKSWIEAQHNKVLMSLREATPQCANRNGHGEKEREKMSHQMKEKRCCEESSFRFEQKEFPTMIDLTESHRIKNLILRIWTKELN
jgi:hypothetical protein